MSFLVPHRFKRIGTFLMLAGFTSWVAMQKGIWTEVLTALFGADKSDPAYVDYYLPNAIIAILSFFGFLAGMYLLAFSREKVEDEMIQKLRLESFQFAAAVQIIAIVIGFILMVFREPGQGGLMLFFVSALALFWICFIARFNFIVHVKLRHD
jgi:hypothetical protein